jgi:hypothetical protein
MIWWSLHSKDAGYDWQHLNVDELLDFDSADGKVLSCLKYRTRTAKKETKYVVGCYDSGSTAVNTDPHKDQDHLPTARIRQMGLQAPPTESIDSVKDLILSVNENQRTRTHRDKRDKKHRKRKSNETSELPPPKPPQQPPPPPIELSPEKISTFPKTAKLKQTQNSLP